MKITGTWMENKELSDAWTVFTRFILLNERTPDGYTWSGERLTRKQTTSRPDNVRPDMWKHMSDASKKKAKQKWAIEKTKLDKATRLRGIFFIGGDDEEVKCTMKIARRKFKITMPAAMICKTPINSGRESTRIRLEGAPERYHEYHVAAKGLKSLSHYNLVHKFIPIPQALKIQDDKDAVEKEWKHWKRYRHGT